MGGRESRSAPTDDATASRRRRMDLYRESASFDASTYARSSGYSPHSSLSSTPTPVPSSSSTPSPPLLPSTRPLLPSTPSPPSVRRRRMDLYRESASFDASTYARSSEYLTCSSPPISSTPTPVPSSPPPVPSSSSTPSPPSVRLADNVRKDPPTKENCSSLGGATALGSGTHTDTQHTVTAEEVLDQFRDQFIKEMDAEAVVGDLLHNNIIDEGDKRIITSARKPRLQNQELHLCLRRKCTLGALMTVCDIMTAVGGNPKMLALGEVIKRRLETGMAMAVNPSPNGSALSLESFKMDIVSCDVNVFESQKHPAEAIRILYFNAYNHLIRILSTHCSAIKSVALSAVRSAVQVSVTEVEVKEACDLRALFECLEVDKKWNDLHFLDVAIMSLPVEASKEKGAAQLVLRQYKSYLTDYEKAVSIKEGKSVRDFLQRKRGREGKMVVTEITIDKEIDEYTCHDLLDLWKLFLIENLEIPEDHIEYRLARAGNSTTLVFMITQTYAEDIKKKLSKPAAMWVMKELGILRVYATGMVSMDLREVPPNVLIASIREGLESGVDFVSLTKVFSRQFLALVGPTDHPLENSNNAEVQHRRLLMRLLKAPPSHRCFLQESHDKDVPQTLKVEHESEGRMQLQSAYAGERHMPIAFPSEPAEGESDPHKEPEPATVKDRKAVVPFVHPAYDVEEADRYYLKKAIMTVAKNKKLDTLKLMRDLYRHTYYSVERILDANPQHFRHMVRAAELATENEEDERRLSTACTVEELLDTLCIKTKLENTDLLAEIVLSLPEEPRTLAMSLLKRYEGYLEVYDNLVPAQDSLQMQLAVPEGTKPQVAVEVTVKKRLDEFMNKDCKDIVNLLLHNSYKIPRIKIMVADIPPGSTTVVFLIDKAFTENIIHSSRKVSPLWAFQELRVTRVRFGDFELNVVQLLTQHFMEALRGGLTGSMDFVGATKALPYQVYALVDPDISEKLITRTVFGKIAQSYSEQEEFVSGTADSEGVETTSEMEEDNFPPKVEEEAELDDEGKIKETTDSGELRSRVQELEEELKNSEGKMMDLTHENMALVNHLKVCQKQKDHTEQEIASLKKRLFSMLSSQGGADKDSALTAPSDVCSKRPPHRWWLKVSAGSYDTSLLPSHPTEQAEGGREMQGEVVFRRDTKSNLLKAVSGTEWMYQRGALRRGRRANLRRHQFTRYHRRWLADNVQKEEEDSCKLWLLQWSPDVGIVRARQEHGATELKESERKRMDLIQSNAALQKIIQTLREEEGRTQQEMADLKTLSSELSSQSLITSDTVAGVLQEAAREGNRSLLQLMVKQLFNVESKGGRTPLLLAAERGHTDLVKLITEQYKGDIFHKMKNSRNVLHLAACKGHLPVLKYLCPMFGDRLLDRDAYDESCLDIAQRLGQRPIVTFLTENYPQLEDKGGAGNDFALTAPSQGPSKRAPRHRWWLKVSAESSDTSLIPFFPKKHIEGCGQIEGEVVFRRDARSKLMRAVSGTEWMYQRGVLERGRRAATTAPHQQRCIPYHQRWLADNVLEEEEESFQQWWKEVLPQSPLPPSLRKVVHSVKLPDMPMRAASFAATIHNSKVYISAIGKGGNGKPVSPVLVYSISEHKWSTLPEQQHRAVIAVLNNHITLIGGRDLSTGKVTNILSTWYEEEGQWKQVLPSMPTGRFRPTVISHDNLLLVTGGVAEDDSVLNTTDILDLTTMKWTTPQGLSLPIPLWGPHLTLCGEYIYLMRGAMVHPWKSPEDDNSQAWRAKWSDVKQTAASQHSQPQRGVWTKICDPLTLSPTPVSCGGALYTVGGRTRVDKLISTVYTYIPARNQWVSVGDMSVRRFRHCAVPLSSSSTIFVAGGRVVNEDVVNEGKWAYYSLTELLLL